MKLDLKLTFPATQDVADNYIRLPADFYLSKISLYGIGDYTYEVSVFLYDLKILNNQQHKKYTGVSNNNIIKNLETLQNKRKNTILRFTIVDGITNTKENLNDILNFVSLLKGINDIDLLPFHNVNEKYHRIGKEYKLKGIQPPSEKDIVEIKKLFEQKDLNVRIGG